jgi:hypothetical protein
MHVAALLAVFILGNAARGSGHFQSARQPGKQCASILAKGRCCMHCCCIVRQVHLNLSNPSKVGAADSARASIGMYPHLDMLPCNALLHFQADALQHASLWVT